MILPSENQVHEALTFHLRTVLKHALDLYKLIKPFNLSAVVYYSLYEKNSNSAINFSVAHKVKFASLNYAIFSCSWKHPLHLANNK